MPREHISQENTTSRPGSSYLQFGILLCVSLFVFWKPLFTLAEVARVDNRYSHSFLVPLVVCGLVWLHRHNIFEESGRSKKVAIPLIVLSGAAGLWWNSQLQIAIASLILFWMAGFLWLFGVASFRKGLGPLLFLIFLIPLPALVLERVESVLQLASAEVTAVVFSVTNTPVYRQGMQFSLPGVTIEVARECSGIRSTIGTLIACCVLSYLFLRTSWARTAFILMALPVTVFKNAVRIAVLSWLGVFVSKDYLWGELHRSGGPVFAVFSFAILVPVLLLLRQFERTRRKKPDAPSGDFDRDSPGGSKELANGPIGMSTGHAGP